MLVLISKVFMYTSMKITFEKNGANQIVYTVHWQFRVYSLD